MTASIVLVCKHCDSEHVLTQAGSLDCPGCGRNTGSSEALLAARAALADEMARLRSDWRFEVLLETDDLPAPHGYDAEYILPEDHRKLAADGDPGPPCE